MPKSCLKLNHLTQDNPVGVGVGQDLNPCRKGYPVGNDADRGGIADQLLKRKEGKDQSQENEEYFHLKCLCVFCCFRFLVFVFCLWFYFVFYFS